MGERVKELLRKYRLTQVWLLHQLKKYGIEADKSELSSILSESRSGPKTRNVLAISLEILNEYGMSKFR